MDVHQSTVDSYLDEAVAAAVDMGKARQLTNIMRDVRQDAERGRIYLALEDLATFGYDEAALLSFSYSDEFKLLMAEYGTRANAFYESGERLLPLLDSARSRMCCNGLQGVSRSILEEIIRRDYDVYSGRVSPSKAGRRVRRFRLWMSGARPRWAYGSPPAWTRPGAGPASQSSAAGWPGSGRRGVGRGAAAAARAAAAKMATVIWRGRLLRSLRRAACAAVVIKIDWTSPHQL